MFICKKLIKLKILVIFIFFSSASFADNHNIYETLENIQNDLKTLERAVYSGSIEVNTSTNEQSNIELGSNSEDVLTRHLLKLSEIENQFLRCFSRFWTGKISFSLIKEGIGDAIDTISKSCILEFN